MSLNKDAFVIRVTSFSFQDKRTLECEWCGAFTWCSWVPVDTLVMTVHPGVLFGQNYLWLSAQDSLHRRWVLGPVPFRPEAEGWGEARGACSVFYVRASS